MWVTILIFWIDVHCIFVVCISTDLVLFHLALFVRCFVSLPCNSQLFLISLILDDYFPSVQVHVSLVNNEDNALKADDVRRALKMKAINLWKYSYYNKRFKTAAKARKTKAYFRIGEQKPFVLATNSFHHFSSEINVLFYLQSLRWLLFLESPVLGKQKNLLKEKCDRFLNLHSTC